MTPTRAVSIVLPVLNEAARLPGTLRSLPRDAEVIVVDGGSSDGSREITRAFGVRCLHLPGRPRGTLLNAGAAEAAGNMLLFLHADTRLPPDAVRLVRDTLGVPDTTVGAFSLSFEDAGATLKLIARGANLRSRWLRLPYGDQALFTRRDSFRKVGGFPDCPLLEDVALVRRLRSIGRLVVRPERVVTSPRRYARFGPWHTIAMNGVTLLRFALGASPWTLSREYTAGRYPELVSSAKN